MARWRNIFSLLCLCLLMGSGVLGYYFWHRYFITPFSCRANFIQHNSDETLYIWLNYTVEGTRGILSMNGHIQSDLNKKIDRKIYFKVQREDGIYIFTSLRNMKFPSDNVNDNWLKGYEPLFFIYPNKEIYIKIEKLRNGNHLFSLEALPTYVCQISKN